MFSVIFFIHIVMHSIRQALRVYLRHWHFSILNLQNASKFFPFNTHIFFLNVKLYFWFIVTYTICLKWNDANVAVSQLGGKKKLKPA